MLLLFTKLPPYVHLYGVVQDVILIGGRGILIELSLLHYNGAQWYEQFLQVGRLDRALILFGLALCLSSASVSSVFMVRFIFKFVGYILNFAF